MKAYITEGMFGKKLKVIAEADDFDRLFKKIAEWKSLPEVKAEYKVEKYDRFLLDSKNDQTAIDFGDYGTFILIDKLLLSKL